MIRSLLLALTLGTTPFMKPVGKPIQQPQGSVCSYVKDAEIKKILKDELKEKNPCLCRSKLLFMPVKGAPTGFLNLGYFVVVAHPDKCERRIDKHIPRPPTIIREEAYSIEL